MKNIPYYVRVNKIIILLMIKAIVLFFAGVVGAGFYQFYYLSGSKQNFLISVCAFALVILMYYVVKFLYGSNSNSGVPVPRKRFTKTYEEGYYIARFDLPEATKYLGILEDYLESKGAIK